MDDEVKAAEMAFKANPKSQDTLFRYATKLYTTPAYTKEVEKLFTSHLRKSYDLRFWNLYIEYVKKVSTKKVGLVDVYAFVITHFENSYDSAQIIREYLAEIANIDDDNTRIERTRKVYQKALCVPLHGISALWNEYERWEFSTNKSTAKQFVEQMQPIFSQANAVYQRLLPNIESGNVYGILDIELDNPLKLAKKSFDARMNFIFNFYQAKAPADESLVFLHSFFMPESAKVDPFSPFLKIWFSYSTRQNLFDLESKPTIDLMYINYLRWLVKFEGIESFKKEFQQISGRCGPQTTVYAATTELRQGNSKDRAYKILSDALDRHPNSHLLIEQFFLLFLSHGEDESIKMLFKRLKKTERMWNEMITHELDNGDIKEYQSLILARNEAIIKRDILPPVILPVRAGHGSGCKSIYESVLGDFEYLDLRLNSVDPLSEFISKLPKLPDSQNIFSNLDKTKLVEMLLEVPIS